MVLRSIFITTTATIIICVFLSAHAQPEKPQLPAELKAKIDKLLTDLANERWRNREKADEELRILLFQNTENFDAVLSYLKQYLSSTADPEVRTRLERIGGSPLRFGITRSLLKKFPYLVRQLTCPELTDRRAMVEKLGSSKHRDAAKVLIRMLDDPEYRLVRREVVKALGATKDTRVIEPLISALGDTDHCVRTAAVAALRKVGKPAVGLLIKALGDPDKEVGAGAAFALAGIRDKRAIEPLVKVLDHADSSMRQKAAEALGEFYHDGIAAFEPLTKALKDAESRVRSAAASALGKIRNAKGTTEQLLEALSDTSREVRRQAAWALGMTRDRRAVKPLIKALGGGQLDFGTAAKALGMIGDPRAAKVLIEGLGNPSPHLRWRAARALIDIKHKESTELLVKTLRNGCSHTRATAAYTLGRMEQTEAVKPLARALSDNDKIVTLATEEALVRIGEGALEGLRAAMEEEKDEKKKTKLREIIEKIDK